MSSRSDGESYPNRQQQSGMSDASGWISCLERPDTEQTGSRRETAFRLEYKGRKLINLSIQYCSRWGDTVTVTRKSEAYSHGWHILAIGTAISIRAAQTRELRLVFLITSRSTSGNMLSSTLRHRSSQYAPEHPHASYSVNKFMLVRRVFCRAVWRVFIRTYHVILAPTASFVGGGYRKA